MTDINIVQTVRRDIGKSWQLLDKESYGVSVTRGKIARIFDIVCKDKSGDKLVKVCYQTIASAELLNLLHFNDACPNTNTIIEIHVWDDYTSKPQRFKLFYNQPKQVLSPDLQKLVK